MSTPTDAEIADLCAQIYEPNAVNIFDYFDAGADDGVCWGLVRRDGADVIVFRGSVTLRDWLRDLNDMLTSTRVGHVHSGFYAGMERTWAEVQGLLRQGAIVAGHSLGAAHADILTGLMVADGVPPIARVVFGEPKPGLLDFAKIVERVPGRSYRNGDPEHHDLITDVPFSFPPLQYVHPTPIIPVCCRPNDGLFSELGLFAWHGIDLYQKALASLLATAPAA